MPVFSIGFNSSAVRTGTQEASRSLDLVTSSARKAEQQVFKVTDSFKSLATAALAAVGAYKSFDTISSFVKNGLEYNRQMESTKLGIDSVIASTMNLVDSQDRMLEGAQKFTAAQKLSVDMTKALDTASSKSAAGYSELLTAYQAVLAPAGKLGLSWRETLDVTVQMSNAISSLNIPMEKLARETEAVLTGKNLGTSDIGRKLGLKTALKDLGSAQAIMAGFNKQIGEPMKNMGEGVEKSLAEIDGKLTDALGRYSAEISTGLFESIKKAKLTIAESFHDYDSAGNIKIKDDLREVSQLFQDIQSWFGSGLESAASGFVSTLQTLNDFIKENRSTMEGVIGILPTVAGGYITWSAAMKIANSESVKMLQFLGKGAAEKRTAAVEAYHLAAAEKETAIAVQKSALVAKDQAVSNRLTATTMAERKTAAATLAQAELVLANADRQIAISSTQAAAAQTKMQLAMKATIGTSTTLKGSLSGVAGMLGGPVGIAMMGAGAAITYLMTQESEAEKLNQRYGASFDALIKGGEDSSKAFEDLTQKINKMSESATKLHVLSLEKSMSKLKTELLDMQEFGYTRMGDSFGTVAGGPFNQVLQDLANSKISAEQFKEEVEKIGVAFKDVERAQKLLTKSSAWRNLKEEMKVAADHMESFKNNTSGAASEANILTKSITEFAKVTSTLEEKILQAKRTTVGQAVATELMKLDINIDSKDIDQFGNISSGVLEKFDQQTRDAIKRTQTLARELHNLSLSVPTSSLSSNIQRHTESAMSRGIQYEYGSRHSYTGKIDCSGWIVEMNADNLAIKKGATAAGIIKEVSQISGELLRNFDLTPDKITEGMLIGLDASSKDKDRWKGIDHIVQTYLDSRTGKMMVSESSRGGGGVISTAYEDWWAKWGKVKLYGTSINKGAGSEKDMATTARAVATLNDELTKLTGTEKEYSEFKLNKKLAELEKQLGSTTPEFQKLAEIEKLALSSGYNSGNEMVSSLRNVRKELDIIDLDTKGVQLHALEEKFSKLKTALAGGVPSQGVSFDELERLYEIQKRTIETGYDPSKNAELLREFNKEVIELTHGETEAKKQAVQEQMELYRLAGAERVQLEYWTTQKLLELETSWEAGVKRGFRNYTKEMGDQAKLAETFVTNSFSNMEDSFVSFVKTGKLDFTSMVDSMIEDLIRLSYRMAMFGQDGNGGLLGGLLGTLGSSLMGGFSGSSAPTSFSTDASGYGWFSYNHSGGIAGEYAQKQSLLPLSLLDDAKRYHTGGIIGADEVPAILQRGELVVPEHIAKGLAPISELRAFTAAVAANSGNGGGQQVNITVNNEAGKDVETEWRQTPSTNGQFNLEMTVKKIYRADVNRGGIDSYLQQRGVKIRPNGR